MKKYMTVAALLAAGTAFANADSLTFATVGTVSGTDGGNYCGIVFTLGGTDTARFGSNYSGILPEELNLDSISVQWRGNNTSDYSDRYLYITDSSNVVLAVSDLVSIEGGNTGTGTFTFSDSLVLDTTATYYAYFAVGQTISSYITVGEVLQSRAYNSCNLAMIGSKDTSTVAQWGGLAGGVQTTASPTFAPNMTIVASTIPEPSAFGLLAGVGALALVAARRRRHAK